MEIIKEQPRNSQGRFDRSPMKEARIISMIEEFEPILKACNNWIPINWIDPNKKLNIAEIKEYYDNQGKATGNYYEKKLFESVPCVRFFTLFKRDDEDGFIDLAEKPSKKDPNLENLFLSAFIINHHEHTGELLYRIPIPDINRLFAPVSWEEWGGLDGMIPEEIHILVKSKDLKGFKIEAQIIKKELQKFLYWMGKESYFSLQSEEDYLKIAKINFIWHFPENFFWIPKKTWKQIGIMEYYLQRIPEEKNIKKEGDISDKKIIIPSLEDILKNTPTGKPIFFGHSSLDWSDPWDRIIYYDPFNLEMKIKPINAMIRLPRSKNKGTFKYADDD